MTTFIIGALTVILVLNCLFLILLILVQLPKKEAGIGMAFGGAATETLFGAGSGTVLTRATKYSAAIFMCLSLLLAILNTSTTQKAGIRLDEELQRLANTGTGPAITSTATSNTLPVEAAETTPSQPAETPGTASSPLLLSTTNAATPPQ